MKMSGRLSLAGYVPGN